MGDLMKNLEIFRKLGLFDQSNQWLLYDDRFEKFFNFLAENITDLNIISEDEVVTFKEVNLTESDKLKIDQISEEELKMLKEIEMCSPDKIKTLSVEVRDLKQMEQEYKEMLDMARIGKTKANKCLNELEEEHIRLEVGETEVSNQCLLQAKQLEALQEENKQLHKESQNRFSITSPPTLFHLLPLEDYCSKVDACNHYLTLYLQQNYKLLEYHKFETHQSDDVAELLHKMNNLKDIIEHFTFRLLDEERRSQVSFAMIDEVQSNKIDEFDIHDIARKTHELALLNEHHLKVSNETLLNELKTCIQEVSQQRIEVVLLENTKLKLERATKRRENAKTVEHLIKEMLLISELVWAGIQLDMERIQNRVDVQKQQAVESQAAWQRIRKMYDISAAADRTNLLSMFLETFAELLAGTSKMQSRVRCDIKTQCLSEYESFSRQVSQALQYLVKGQSCVNARSKLQNIANIEGHLLPIVHDSPIEAPQIFSAKYYRSIFRAGECHANTVKELRSLRLQFQSKISEKMEKDAFFRANHLLWVWFLQDPPRVIRAIEEARRTAAAKTMSSVKVLSGIKRKH